MSKERHSEKKATTIYGNCKILAPDGAELCLCTEKRINWYLSRGLAAVVNEEPIVIKLNFEPKGKWRSNDVYSLSYKENKCVVCGEGDLLKLTKHHIVPHCYRKYMEYAIKARYSHDIVITCYKCHRKYETVYALQLKRELEKKYNAPLSGRGLTTKDSESLLASKYAATLLKHSEKIPENKKLIMFDKIKSFLKIEIIDESSLLKLSDIWTSYNSKENFVLHGKIIMNNISNIQEFVEMWRKHFIETMKPKFMPTGWDINRPIDINKSKVSI